MHGQRRPAFAQCTPWSDHQNTIYTPRANNACVQKMADHIHALCIMYCAIQDNARPTCPRRHAYNEPALKAGE